MKLDHALKTQKLFNRSRSVGINPNHWYPVAWADRLKPRRIERTTLWQQHIALYRDADGTAHALEDACLHKGVALHKGEVVDGCVVCPYHGWRYDGQGRCVSIPYYPEQKKLPSARVRSYPVHERYNLIWVFPGDPDLAEASPVPEIAEYGDPNWLIVEVPARFPAHFCVVNENPLDVFHGYLHRDLPGWYDPVLVGLERDGRTIKAEYDVTFRNGWLARLFGLAGDTGKETRRKIVVGYHYPHCRNTMPGKSNYYFMRQPVGPTETQSYGFLCLQIRLPQWLVRRIRKPLSRILWRFLVKPFLVQDIEMMESEQQTYLRDPERRNVEINPVISAAQRLTVEQYDLHLVPTTGGPSYGDA